MRLAGLALLSAGRSAETQSRDTGMASNSEAAQIRGHVSLEEVVVPTGVEVHFQFSSFPSTLHLHFECVAVETCKEAQLSFILLDRKSGGDRALRASGLVQARVAEKSADVSLSLVAKPPVLLFADANVDSLGLLDMRDSPAPVGETTLLWSGVESGSLRLPSVNRTVQIEAGN